LHNERTVIKRRWQEAKEASGTCLDVRLSNRRDLPGSLIDRNDGDV
jgi:hypothetical protein